MECRTHELHPIMFSLIGSCLLASHQLFAYLAFAVSVIWIFSTANEVVNLLQVGHGAMHLVCSPCSFLFVALGGRKKEGMCMVGWLEGIGMEGQGISKSGLEESERGREEKEEKGMEEWRERGREEYKRRERKGKGAGCVGR